MEVDNEQVEFIRSLMSDESKTWKQRWDSLVAWNREHRGWKGCHATFGNKKDGTAPTEEEMCEELCRIVLGRAEGRLEEVDVTGQPL